MIRHEFIPGQSADLTFSISLNDWAEPKQLLAGAEPDILALHKRIAGTWSAGTAPTVAEIAAGLYEVTIAAADLAANVEKLAGVIGKIDSVMTLAFELTPMKLLPARVIPIFGPMYGNPQDAFKRIPLILEHAYTGEPLLDGMGEPNVDYWLDVSKGGAGFENANDSNPVEAITDVDEDPIQFDGRTWYYQMSHLAGSGGDNLTEAMVIVRVYGPLIRTCYVILFPQKISGSTEAVYNEFVGLVANPGTLGYDLWKLFQNMFDEASLTPADGTIWKDIKNTLAKPTANVTLMPTVAAGLNAGRIGSGNRIDLFQNCDRVQPIPALDGDGAAIDLTGRTLRFIVHEEADATLVKFVVENADIAVTGADHSTAQVTIAAALVTTAWKNCVWELLNVESGNTYPLNWGPLNVRATAVEEPTP